MKQNIDQQTTAKAQASKTEIEILTVSQEPSADMPVGVYKVISNGLYFGHYRIVTTWTGEKAVIHTCKQDIERFCKNLS